MGKVIKIIVKILMVVIIAAGVAAGDYWFVRHNKWPLWYGGAIFLLILGLVLGFFFIRRVILKSRAKKFVKQVVKQEDVALESKVIEKKIRLDSIQNTFNRAIGALKKSKLQRIGDPVYMLPWYMMIGEPGSGKTTSLRNSGLISSFPELSQDTGAAGTQYFNFWFYKEAIVLDVSGRYAVSVHEAKDREEEWQHFLAMLVTHRRKEPLNGIIVTVSADKFLHGHKAALEDYGRDIRVRINQVMRTIGASFPIYIMITKADLIPGMESFSDLLPHSALKQALGYINPSTDKTSSEALNDAIRVISEQLKELRLLVLYHHEGADPSVLLLPEEVAKLKEGLTPFAKVIFQESPYEEPPIFRGLFLSSGVHDTSLQPEATEPADTNQQAATRGAFKSQHGAFLRDFFSQVIPADRGLHSPTREFISWRRHTKTLGISSWLLICVAILGLLTMSFVKNIAEINSFSKRTKDLPPLSGGQRLFDDIFILNDFLSSVLALETANRHWIIPRMGLHQSQKLETYLKEEYTRKYKPILFFKTNKELFDKIISFNENTPDSVIGDYAEHLAKRVNIHLAVLEGKSPEDILKMPGPFDNFLPFVDKDLVATAGPYVNKLYLYWEIWSSDLKWVKVRNQELQTQLLRILDLKNDNAHWMVAWANDNSDLTPVTIEDFWRVGFSDSSSSVKAIGSNVPPAFTIEGRQRIDNLFDLIRQALRGKSDIASVKNGFTLWYNNEYINAWYNFAQYFYNQAMTLSEISNPEFNEAQSPVAAQARGWSQSDWQAMGLSMTTPSNPFFLLLDRMAVELESVKDSPTAPRWLVLLINFHLMKSQAESKTFWQETISIAQSTQAGGGLIQSSQSTREINIKNPTYPLDVHLKAIKGFQDYEAALSSTTPVLASTDHAYQMVLQLFKALSDPSAPPSPFDNANAAVGRLKALLSSSPRDEKIFWDLFQGPPDFIQYYLIINTSCTLQRDWEGNVLSLIPSIPENKLENELFGDSGIVWKFLHGELDPFISRDQRGYYAVTLHSSQIPFNPEFFKFINRGQSASLAIEPEYNVIIKTLPVDINPDAQEKPSGVILEVSCTNGMQRLENYNYPLIKSIKWTPGSCGDVQLDIIIGDMTLTKKYSGYRGFPSFLVDFMDGEKTFTPEDFPDQADEMAKLSIKKIQVQYEFKGQGPVMKLNEEIPTAVPRKITWCNE